MYARPTFNPNLSETSDEPARENHEEHGMAAPATFASWETSALVGVAITESPPKSAVLAASHTMRVAFTVHC